MILPQDSQLTFRRAKLTEKLTILEIFSLVTDWMMEKGIRQWDYSYPNINTITEDIQANSKWLAVSDEKNIIGTITINQRFDEQYSGISWDETIAQTDVWSIHRLAVHPDYFGNGIGENLCLFAEKLVKENGGKSIRLDAYSENQISNKLYEKLGYELKEGKLFFHNNEIPFNAYEKLLLR